jgi:hypothetical protein
MAGLAGEKDAGLAPGGNEPPLVTFPNGVKKEKINIKNKTNHEYSKPRATIS